MSHFLLLLQNTHYNFFTHFTYSAMGFPCSNEVKSFRKQKINFYRKRSRPWIRRQAKLHSYRTTYLILEEIVFQSTKFRFALVTCQTITAPLSSLPPEFFLLHWILVSTCNTRWYISHLIPWVENLQRKTKILMFPRFRK